MRSKPPLLGLERFYAQLELNHLRKTAARDALFEAVRDFGPISQSELVAKLAQIISVASVYRDTASLLEAGIFDRVLGGQLELSDRFKQHHHYLVCRSCHRKIPFNDEQTERAIGSIATKREFALEEHRLELSGLCSGCRRDGETQRLAIGTNLRR